MIDELEIRGFRSFSELVVQGLTQVNVIVGRNNAGKTSLLDALDLLFLREHPMGLVRSLWRRQEIQARGIAQGGPDSDFRLDARQLFYGRKLDSGSCFRLLGKTGGSSILLDVAVQPERGSAGPRTMSRIVQEAAHFVLRLETETRSFEQGLYGKSLLLHTALRGSPDELVRPYVYVGTGLMEGRDRGRLWDLIVGNEDEDFVTEALKAVEPSVERVLFTVGDGERGTPTPFVRLRGVPERVPLGNLGHGAARLLEIAMLLVQARDGAFLMDEIEIGLHYSVMASVWRLILATARRLNIQVFATTHSQDCLQALAGLYQNDRSLANVVSLHRLDGGAAKSERFSMDDIEIAEDSKLELRGLP